MTDREAKPAPASMAHYPEGACMAYGRSKLYGRGNVAERGDVSSAAATEVGPRTLRESHREIDTLRAINAQLIQQVKHLKRREAHAQRLADRDGLTGLFNRRRMLELLEVSMADADGQGDRVGLLFIDLDSFKGINDDFGHIAGDKLLVSVGARIAARARSADYVCRFGGDEFVVILPRVGDLAALQHVAGIIGRRIALPYHVEGLDLQVSASIGVALYPDGATTAEELLRLADQSMYRVKAHGNERHRSEDGSEVPSRRLSDKTRRRLGM